MLLGISRKKFLWPGLFPVTGNKRFFLGGGSGACGVCIKLLVILKNFFVGVGVPGYRE